VWFEEVMLVCGSDVIEGYLFVLVFVFFLHAGKLA
jgi:hypothetical protein